MKKIIRLTERDLTRLVKRIIKESNGDELEELRNGIDDICEEYQDEVKQMVKRNGSLNLDEAKEILSDLKNNLEEFLHENSHDEMEDEDYFDLEEYAGDCVSNFISFLNEHTD
jgi:vacuolar-type H+-ATPase catalytic subunit A/Vma1